MPLPGTLIPVRRHVTVSFAPSPAPSPVPVALTPIRRHRRSGPILSENLSSPSVHLPPIVRRFPPLVPPACTLVWRNRLAALVENFVPAAELSVFRQAVSPDVNFLCLLYPVRPLEPRRCNYRRRRRGFGTPVIGLSASHDSPSPFLIFH